MPNVGYLVSDADAGGKEHDSSARGQHGLVDAIPGFDVCVERKLRAIESACILSSSV